MLATRFSHDTPLPLPGSTGFLRGTAERVTVLQRGADDTCTVKIEQPPYLSPEQRLEWARRGASLTRRVAEADIYPTEREAQFCGRPPKGRRTRARRA